MGGFIETNNESTNDTIIVASNKSQIEEIAHSLVKTLFRNNVNINGLH